MFSELKAYFQDMSVYKKIICVLCVFLSGYDLLAATVIRINYWVHYPMNLLIAALVICLTSMEKRGKVSIGYIFDAAIGLAAVFSIGYYMLNYSEMLFRTTKPTDYDTFFGIICIIVCLTITRKATGSGLFIVTAAFLTYGFFGQYLPAPFGHAGFKVSRLVRMIFGEVGIFGSPLTATATFVFLFCLFGAFLQNFAGGQFFIDLATGAAGKFRGGPAKVAVISSALFGTVSGSAIANVVTTGTFTIPLMKKTGYKDYFAGAVEAVASTGGQIMPPVMGATAFIMAEMTGIPYSEICIAALIPAALFFFSVFVMIDLEAVKLNLKGLDPEQVPDIKQILRDKWPLLSPLIGIILMLLVFKMSSSRTAVVAILITIIAPLIKRNIKITLTKVIDALYDGAHSCVSILASCTCAGIIIAVLAVTGLGVKLGSLLISLSGGYMWGLLFLTMLITIILGMGLPTPSAYIVCVSVVGQTLIEAGIPLMAAHLFIFYYAILSTVTPPVAMSAYTAAGIAKSNPNKTGWQGLGLGLVAFIVPYMFVFGPALLMNGTPLEILRALCTAIVGVLCLGVAIIGYMKAKVSLPLRAAFLMCAFLLIDTSLLTDIIGVGVAAISYFLAMRKSKLAENTSV